MAVYTNDLRLKEIATGDESGTWGTSTNTNLGLIADAFGFGTEAITTNADVHTTTIADGSADPGRSIFLKYTGTLDSACTITIGPNTVSKLWLIENATSGSQNIIIKQGSGATVTIANGQTKAIYSDGAGSGGAMVDAFQDLSVPDLFIDDDLTFTSDSAVITFGADGDTTLTHTDGSGLTLNSTNKLMFNDASQFIQGSSATVLSLGATDEIDLTATAIDINGTLDVSGAITSSAGATITVSDNSDTLSLVSTDADASNGPVLRLYRNSSSPADNDFLGNIQFVGRNDNSQDVQYAEEEVYILDASDGTEDGLYNINVITGGTNLSYLQLKAGTGSVFNEDSNDVDFRVESDSNSHMLFVDAGNNRVGINESSPDNALHINGGSDNTVLKVESTDTAVNIELTDLTGSSFIKGRADLRFEVGSADVVQMLSGETVVNNDSNDYDFRVESDSKTHALFVQGSDGFVGINATPTHPLEVAINSSGQQDLLLLSNDNTATSNTAGILFAPSNGITGARIECVAMEDFSSSANRTADLAFYVRKDGTISERMRLDSDGALTVTRSDNGAVLTVKSTDTDSSRGPILDLNRASASSAADNDFIGELRFLGNNDADESIAYAGIAGRIIDASDGTEDGRFEMYTELAGAQISRILAISNETVVNQDSADLDFRVESNSDTHMLFVDAANDKVGIGVSDPAGTPLHLKVSSGDNRLRQETAAKDAFTLGFENSTGDTIIGTHEIYPAVRFLANGGICFGSDTAAANALDDYEEGTFTPTFTLGGGSATIDSSEDLCTYTKIGRLVTVSGRIKIGSVSSPSSFFIISNLPFTVTSFGENSNSNAVAVNLYALASSITGAINAEMHSQGILIRDNGSTTGDVQNMADHFDDGTRIGFTATYPTTD